MRRHLDHALPHTPGRCDCCGHLMIMLPVDDTFTGLRSTNWHCLLCDRIVGWKAMSRRCKTKASETVALSA